MMDDQSLIEAMDEFENDRVLAETAEALERQVNTVRHIELTILIMVCQVLFRVLT